MILTDWRSVFQLARDFVTPGSLGEVTLGDVVGHEEVERSLEEVAVLPMAHPELFRYKVNSILRSSVPTFVSVFRKSGLRQASTTCLLLCGPPGTGKTLLARAVASSLHMPFLDLR